MYGSHEQFKGRITGFTMGTGSTLALLPAENATGNFVKVVQRLPVRIDLIDYDPDKMPLFIGLSVTPSVHINEEPTGPDARQSLAALSTEHNFAFRTGNAAMTSTAIDLQLTRPRTVNPWLIATAVVIPTFMEVLDTTIANVALRYIAGGLSAPATDSEWVITSYLAANAIILPISAGWAQSSAGEIIFLVSIAIFTMASALCGAPQSQRFDRLPRASRSRRRRIATLQPGHSSRRIPSGKTGRSDDRLRNRRPPRPRRRPNARRIHHRQLRLALDLLSQSPCRPPRPLPLPRAGHRSDYLKAQRAQMRKSHDRFDALGLCLLSITMVSWEIMLSKGQEWDWLGDPFCRIQTLLVLFVLCLGGLIYRETRIANPLINFRTLLDRNFRSCCIIIFCAFGVLYANTTNSANAVAIPFRLRRDHIRIGAFPRGNSGRHIPVRRRNPPDRAASMRAI